MKRTRNHTLTHLLLCPLLLLCLTQTPAAAQSQPPTLSFFEAVFTQVENFLNQLDGFIDRQVRTENRRKLIRDLDRLNKGLYQLERDKRAFVESLFATPVDQPRLNKTRNALQASIGQLQKNLGNLGYALRTEGAGREASAEIQTKLYQALKGKETVLAQITGVALANAGNERAQQLRKEEEHALTILQNAQTALTTYLDNLRGAPAR